LRRIVHGGADQSFGIEVAKLAGVPSSVTKRAKVILKELEANKIEIDFKAQDSVIEEAEDDIQFNFKAKSTDEMIELLKALDINTLTPIEAMQTLYELKKKAEDA
ncbi:MAG: DNA mismatch repair protein MutS, partial [Eubacterium sp.]